MSPSSLPSLAPLEYQRPVSIPSERRRRRYTVNSLDRGLAILRIVREMDAPVRNQDVVMRTGLAKSTVSRLMNTLIALRYLRRIDQGTYVLGDTSSRAGHAMLAGLKLHRMSPAFAPILQDSASVVKLETHIAAALVPVYRWSDQGAQVLHQGTDTSHPIGKQLAALCDAFLRRHTVELTEGLVESCWQELPTRGSCHSWCAASSMLLMSVPFALSDSEGFVLSAELTQNDRPTDQRIVGVRSILQDAAASIFREHLGRSHE